MISCIEWVPKGVANPTPKKYEMSAVELELLENQAKLQAALEDHDVDDDSNSDDDNDDDVPQKSTIQLPKIDPSTLPADLRMDEYTDDDDDDDEYATANDAARAGSRIGRMLVGNDDDSEMNDADQQDSEDDAEELHDQDVHNPDGPIDKDSDEDSDDDDDDDDALDDIPDTREFMPVDIQGLQAMGISHAGASALLNPNYDLDDDDDDDDDSDADDHNLTPDDAIVVIAKTEDDFASLEVHVYEERTGNLFVHHDIPLPSFPLCLAHGDINHDGGAGNYIAVGTFLPGIEIWNLDVLQVLEPTCILGGEDTSAADELMKINMTRAATGKKLKKLQQQKQKGGRDGMRPGSHSDAVMALSWSKIHRQVIASGSADKTVKIWDVTKAMADGGNVATFTHHKDKVQSVVWHPSEGTLLATGSYDRTLALLDVRSSGSSSQNVKRVKISADCESLSWDPHHSQYLTCATEDGVLSTWDVRSFEKPVWSFVVAEYGGVSDLSYNPKVPGMLATCSTNKTVTLWDTYNKDQQPSLAPPLCCGNKSMEVGKLYTLGFYPSSPWLLACGGSGNELALWDMNSEDSVQRRFGDRVGKAGIIASTAQDEGTKELDFEAVMAIQESKPDGIETMPKGNKKKGKKKPAHKKRK